MRSNLETLREEVLDRFRSNIRAYRFHRECYLKGWSNSAGETMSEILKERDRCHIAATTLHAVLLVSGIYSADEINAIWDEEEEEGLQFFLDCIQFEILHKAEGR